MLSRELKLRINAYLDECLQKHLWHLVGVYNWACRQIEVELSDCESRPREVGCLSLEETLELVKLCEGSNRVRLRPLGINTSEYGLYKKVSGNAKRMNCEVSNEAVLSMIYQARDAWTRCLKKTGKKPRLKGSRNRLNSFSFYGDCKVDLEKGRIKLPKLGWIRFRKFDLGNHLQGKKIQAHVTLKRRADGWYAVIRVDAKHEQVVLASSEKVGIDPGMTTLVTLSHGQKFEKHTEYEKKEKQLGKIQRGIGKNREHAKATRALGGPRRRMKLNPGSRVARLHLKISRQRKHLNHQISHDLVEKYESLYWSDDSFRAQQVLFGKSIMSNSPGQLREMIAYKSSSCGRRFFLVSNQNSTVTCHVCKALTGPRRWDGLKVRHWECSGCGTAHDRDRNAAINTLHAGLESQLRTQR